MAGGLVKYRHLNRTSAHRKALLRNLVTSLVKEESIHTTWHKAKEAQRLAEKLITLAKRDNEETRRKAQAILFTPHLLMPKLFGTLRDRYADRPGGYTRVLRTEAKKDDQAQSAILELVDSPKDLRFALTAAAVARDRDLGRSHNPVTERNWAKAIRYRKEGEDEFEAMVAKTRKMHLADPGVELADIEPVIVRRQKRTDEKLKKAKPLHDYWNRGPRDFEGLGSDTGNFGIAGGGGSGSLGDESRRNRFKSSGNSGKALSDALGVPNLRKKSKQAEAE
ncbi:50s ribosomal protein l17 [Ophiostoma piceae UAMH 11346]|uniref:Large ribosomal subunit protein bL17m n=1 Tax=Ophiostoma piceae (strain UAMH 11346) TaxID=1262450 RepID=S3C958_OPHP1|nr:50s ribosomal protein l17 [Ophiostoma piceae UAMH 11346]